MQETTTKTYKTPKEFQHDQKRMAKQGWSVTNTMEHQPQRSMAGKLFVPFGVFTLPKPSIVVTYQRTKK